MGFQNSYALLMPFAPLADSVHKDRLQLSPKAPQSWLPCANGLSAIALPRIMAPLCKGSCHAPAWLRDCPARLPIYKKTPSSLPCPHHSPIFLSPPVLRTTSPYHKGRHGKGQKRKPDNVLRRIYAFRLNKPTKPKKGGRKSAIPIGNKIKIKFIKELHFQARKRAIFRKR